MSVKLPKFKPVGVARTYAELQPLLREIADTCGWSRLEIDRRAGLPDGYTSKALAPVPVGTTDNPSARIIAKMLAGIGAVLVVAKASPQLVEAADLGVRRREERVHARLLDLQVYDAAKRKLARENGKKGAKALHAKQQPTERQANAKRAAQIRWRHTPKRERSRLGRAAVNARWERARREMVARPDLMAPVQV